MQYLQSKYNKKGVQNNAEIERPSLPYFQIQLFRFAARKSEIKSK